MTLRVVRWSGVVKKEERIRPEFNRSIMIDFQWAKTSSDKVF